MVSVHTNKDDAKFRNLKYSVRFLYDLQALRIASGNRTAKHAKEAEAMLSEDDKTFLSNMSVGLNTLEKDALKEVKRNLKGIPIYENWLKHQKGIGPTMSGVLISEFNIEMCDTPSKMWAWCGLAVRDGKADRLKKGEKARYNPWLKSKMVEVMGGCFLKSSSPWRAFYDSYKNRKTNQKLDTCMNCKGTGKFKLKDKKRASKCKNCSGTGGPAPWGCSDKHRHQASIRYMVKMFLLELWKEWRNIEGLPVRVPYAEEYLGKKHHEGSILDLATA